jgi:hypothetical protein
VPRFAPAKKELMDMSISALLVRRVSRDWIQPEESQTGRVQAGRGRPSTELTILITNGDKTMRFMMLVKHAENQGPPPKGFIDEMNKLHEEAVKAGTIRDSGGLSSLAKSTRVRVSKGQVTAVDGPFSEAKEVVGGFAVFELNSRQEAIDGALHFMEMHKNFWPGWEGETEVRQILGPEDFAPKT